MSIGDLEIPAGVGPDHADRFAFWITFKSEADVIASGVRALRRLIALRERAEVENLTDDQCRALVLYAAQHGQAWKARLRDEWMRAAAAPELHRLRNTHGPSWLARFEIPVDDSAGCIW